MARLKDRGYVRKRDTSFARRLEVIVPPTEDVQPTAPASTAVTTPGPSPVSAPTADPVAPSPSQEARKPTPEPTQERNLKSSTVRKKPPRVEKGRGDKTKVRLAFRMPADLVERASVWAEKARCPVNAILRKGFNDLRPSLIGNLEAGIRYTEIPHDRAVEASHSFDTTVMIDSEAAGRVAAEIDPEEITGIEAPLSRWARSRFIEHFDEYLKAKGY